MLANLKDARYIDEQATLNGHAPSQQRFVEATRQWARWCTGIDDIEQADDADVTLVVETMQRDALTGSCSVA